MTYIWILNYAIPIVAFLSLGILIDHLCKPDKVSKQEAEE
ncbi:hypothetical protein J2Z40_002454 [Cytobacillus eiseniae]|uniref:Uncharacterized protein n=1 Tax=Cytobacillus eiseniae TaxID=762947 RepID=A0ABS4RG77_9BACI|nr:hypothetical protein [Cytobacillus eiseniae]